MYQGEEICRHNPCHTKPIGQMNNVPKQKKYAGIHPHHGGYTGQMNNVPKQKK